MAALTTDAEVAAVLRAARTIAVLGAHEEPHKPAFYVPDYLHGQGYRILPVNPVLAGRVLWGEPVRGTLAELGEPVDVVDVFRRPELLPGHLADLLAMAPRPRLVWLQLGITSPEATAKARDAGLEVVDNRCIKMEHCRFFGGLNVVGLSTGVIGSRRMAPFAA